MKINYLKRPQTLKIIKKHSFGKVLDIKNPGRTEKGSNISKQKIREVSDVAKTRERYMTIRNS